MAAAARSPTVPATFAGRRPARGQALPSRTYRASNEIEVTVARPSIPANAASSLTRTPVQVWVVDQPSTQAIGSSWVCCGSASSCRTCERQRAPSADRQPPAAAHGRRLQAGSRPGLVDGKAERPGSRAATRQQERERPQPSADRLADPLREQDHRGAADGGQQRSPRHRRRRRVGADAACGLPVDRHHLLASAQ